MNCKECGNKLKGSVALFCASLSCRALPSRIHGAANVGGRKVGRALRWYRVYHESVFVSLSPTFVSKADAFAFAERHPSPKVIKSRIKTLKGALRYLTSVAMPLDESYHARQVALITRRLNEAYEELEVMTILENEIRNALR